MRGEKLHRHDQQPAGLGSPPRARGKDGGEYAWDGYTGITPACAGKSSLYASFSRSSWDHPRVRGEKDWDKPFSNGLMGSPPRARGKDGLVDQRLRLGGITPRARGKDPAGDLLPEPAGDHPRVRGEKYAIETTAAPALRITPACAGKRLKGPSCQRVAGDHPRVRGEKWMWTGYRSARMGSPPRARGKGTLIKNLASGFGITPACAGKSAFLGRPEHDGIGSPPRARGKVQHRPREPVFCRITPACAGKSAGEYLEALQNGDHPRVRGEKPPISRPWQRRSGSPPRARGKGADAVTVCPTEGITPACAGKSCND